MAPVGRRLKIGDIVLLPKYSCPAPDDGILYAEIIEACMLEKTNKFNASVSKRRPGWVVRVITNDDSQTITLEIPKSYPMIQYCSTELEQELILRPKELLGMLIGRGLLDKDGDEYINYGQVHGVAVRDNVSYCTVVFRKLPDGSTLSNMEFHSDELMEFEVSLLQFTLGLGVGTKFKSADRRVCTLRTILENMDTHDNHDQWLKEFGSISVARADQMVLDPFMESVEISLPKILSGYPSLSRYLPKVEVKKSTTASSVSKNLRVDFNMDDAAFGECVSGNPVTPIRVASSMQAQNQRRQEFRSSAIPQVLPLHHSNSRHVEVKDPVAVQHQPLSVDVQQEQFQRLQISPSGYGSSSPSSSQVPTYSKHGYHPTTAQLQKHMITFRNGAYGKSSTLEQATVGIEAVLSQELLHAVKSNEAYIRAWCIMMGDLMRVPWWIWRNATLLANNFEENYIPVKWSKLPELKAMEVVDMDEFWVLYYAMEAAAQRYYVNSYCVLLGRTRLNLLGGFNVVGGRAGFMAMRVAARKNVIHVLVAYLRLIVSKFIMEVLDTGADPDDWSNREATMDSTLYVQHVRTLLTNLQLNELATRSTAPRGGGGGDGGGGNQPKGDGEWTSRMPKGLRDTIPKPDGLNICLLSYTRQGCKKENDGCTYHHKKAGSPNCPAPLREWIKDTYGSYVAP